MKTNFKKSEMLSLNCKKVQHVKICKKSSTVENVRQLCEELFLLKCIFLLTFTAFGYWNNKREATLLQNVKKQKLNFENHWHFCIFTAMLITYIKGGTPTQIFLERGSIMTRATFVIFWPKLSSFIYWCCYMYYTQVSYTGSWEPLVSHLIAACLQISFYLKPL
jgi:hypothetical protein